MFPFRQPPSKLEVAKKTVSDAAHHLLEAIPVEQIEEKFDDLKGRAALAAAAASASATATAHHAGEIASHKLGEFQNAASHLGEGVSHAAHNAQTAGQNAASIAGARASAASQSARETASHAREVLGEKAKTLASFKERAVSDLRIGGKEAQNAKEVAQQAAQREAAALQARAAASEAKKQARYLQKEAEAAQKEADFSASQAKQAAAKALAELKATEQQARAEAEAKVAEEARAVADAKEQAEQEAEIFLAKTAKKGIKAEAKARALTEKAENSGREIVLNRDDAPVEFAEVQIADGGSKWGWVILGLAVGAILALLLAPTSGRRSRAAIKDRLGKVGDGAVDAVTATSDKVVDIAQRVEGMGHKVEAKLAADGETDDDATVADRVRSILGHHDTAKNIERLNIDCADAVVTLRGPMLDEATQQLLITAVKTVPGVKDVIADFLVDETPEDSSNAVS